MAEIMTVQDLETAREILEWIEADLYKLDQVEVEQRLEGRANAGVAEGMLTKIMRLEAGARLPAIKEGKEKLRQMKILRLTLAVEPTARMITEIGKWVKNRMGESVVVEWGLDRQILGGAVVVWEGRYADLSVEARLTRWWADQGQAVRGEMGL